MLYGYAGHLFPLTLTYIYVCISSLKIIVLNVNINVNYYSNFIHCTNSNFLIG